MIRPDHFGQRRTPFILFLAFFSVCLWALPAFAADHNVTNGWSVSLTAGSNHCIAVGAADCDSVGAGPMTTMGVEYRIGSLGLGLDFAYGGQVGDGAGADDVTIRTMRANPAVRYYMDLGQWELLTGFGFGYSQYKVTDTMNAAVESEARITSLISALTLTWGAAVPLKALYVGGPKGLGLIFRADATFHSKGERCVLWSNAGVCEQLEELEANERDAAGVFGATAGVRYTF